jgi:small subunit ribosomal protein S8e
VKNAIVVIDAAPFRQWYEGHYGIPLGRKKGNKLVSFSLCMIRINQVINNCFFIIFLKTEAEDAVLNKKRSKKTEKRIKLRQKVAKVDPALEEQFQTGRVLGKFIILLLL